MSMFLCPLCGKQASINNYHPENFDDDVNIFHNASLGYRKGFEKILGYDLDEFPELRAQLENRVKKISGFLNIQTESQAKIKELERKVEEEERKRIFSEEKLEEIDIELLLNKLNKALGISYTSVHNAVDKLISRAYSLNKSNQNLSTQNKNLQFRCTGLEKSLKTLVAEKNRLKNENNGLQVTLQQKSEAYRNIETQKNQKINEYYGALTSERNKRKSLEDYIEELDVDVLIKKKK